MANGIITGKEIMARLGITAFQLQDILREAELVAVQDDLIARRTPESDPCLFCDGQRERETGVSYPAVLQGRVLLCEHAPALDVHQLSHRLPPEVYLERLADCPDAPDMVAKPRCLHLWTEEQRTLRIEAAKFLLFELVAYEKANGIELDGDPDAAREIVDSAEALKRALREKLGRDVGEAELSKADREFRAMEKIFSMTGEEAYAVMKADMLVPLIESPSIPCAPSSPPAHKAHDKTPPCPAPEELPDSPVEYKQQLKSMGLDDAEIKHRLYHNGKKSWKLTWWKVHCIVEGLPYPTRGKKAADEKIKFKDDCLRQIRAWREGS